MIRKHLVAGLTLATLALAVWGCSDAGPADPTAPVFSTASSTQLVSCPTVTNSKTTTKTIGPLGGEVKVGPHDLVIPPGALAANTKISLTQLAGTYAQVEVQPHGLTFAKPVELTLSYVKCSVPAGTVLKVVYITDTGLEVQASSDNSALAEVTALLNHFSQYAVAW